MLHTFEIVYNSLYLPLAFVFTSPGKYVVHLGPLQIRWYGLLIASAVLIGTYLSGYLASRRGINANFMYDLIVWLVIAAVPSARIYYVLFEWQEYAQHPSWIFQIWRGGIAIHGAIIGGLVAALIFARLKQIPFWQLTDLVAPSLILGQAIGRWGNFFNSEAFGRPTNLPWKLYIPPENRPLGYEQYSYFHPTFLYESLWDVMVFAILLTLFFRGLKSRPKLKLGTIFLVYLIIYSIGRFWVEGLRTDSLMLGPLRIAQVVSLVGIALGSFGLFWLYKLNRSLPDVVSVSNYDSTSEPPPQTDGVT